VTGRAGRRRYLAGGMVPGALPQPATPAHQESQTTTKRRASESSGSALNPLKLRPRKVFNGDLRVIMAYSAESCEAHFADQIETSDTDPEVFDDDGSDSGSDSDQ
jgi:hypothetical protein